MPEVVRSKQALVQFCLCAQHTDKQLHCENLSSVCSTSLLQILLVLNNLLLIVFLLCGINYCIYSASMFSILLGTLPLCVYSLAI